MALWFNNPQNESRLYARNRSLDADSSAFGMTYRPRIILMENKISYEQLFSLGNLTLAWRKARKGKTKKKDVIEFPKNLITFVLRDPKTRVISKSDFRDRIVHHALILVIGKLFEKQFIYDSCANQIGKGTIFALKRYNIFSRKVTNNFINN